MVNEYHYFKVLPTNQTNSIVTHVLLFVCNVCNLHSKSVLLERGFSCPTVPFPVQYSLQKTDEREQNSNNDSKEASVCSTNGFR